MMTATEGGLGSSEAPSACERRTSPRRSLPCSLGGARSPPPPRAMLCGEVVARGGAAPLQVATKEPCHTMPILGCHVPSHRPCQANGRRPRLGHRLQGLYGSVKRAPLPLPPLEPQPDRWLTSSLRHAAPMMGRGRSLPCFGAPALGGRRLYRGRWPRHTSRWGRPSLEGLSTFASYLSLGPQASLLSLARNELISLSLSSITKELL